MYTIVDRYDNERETWSKSKLMLEFEVGGGGGLYCIFSNLKRVFLYSIYFDMRILIIAAKLHVGVQLQFIIIIKTLFTHGVHFTKCALPWSRAH